MATPWKPSTNAASRREATSAAAEVGAEAGTLSGGAAEATPAAAPRDPTGGRVRATVASLESRAATAAGYVFSNSELERIFSNFNFV